MNIQFNHDEIVQAIVDYTAKRGISLASSTIEVNLTAGRGANGYSAHVEILANGVSSMEEAASAVVGTTNAQTIESDVDDSAIDEPPFEKDEQSDNTSLFDN